MRRRCGWRASAGHVVDARERNIGGGEFLHELLGIERAGLGGNFAVGFRAPLHAGLVGGEVRIGGKTGVTQNFFQPARAIRGRSECR